MISKNNVIIILGVLLIGIIFGGIAWIDNLYNRAEKAESNLAINQSQWKDEKGRLVSEIEQGTVSIKNMKNIFQKDSSKLSTDYEKRIYGLKRDLNALGIKYKNLLEATGGTMTVRDTFITKFIKKDTTFTANHNDGFLNQNFTLLRDFTMQSDYTYKDEIKVFSIRKPRPKDNGKKHWPNWGNLPWVGWDCNTLILSNNPKASYTGVYSLKTER
jgi:hypothetical protein